MAIIAVIIPNVVMEEDEHATRKMGGIKLEDANSNGAKMKKEQSRSPSPTASLDGIKSRSESADTPSSNKAPRVSASRKVSRKPPQTREPPLFDHLPDATPDSCTTFQVISDCLYGSKNLGSTDSDAFDCDCRDDWCTYTPVPASGTLASSRQSLLTGCGNR